MRATPREEMIVRLKDRLGIDGIDGWTDERMDGVSRDRASKHGYGG